jgi:hypothetical protein
VDFDLAEISKRRPQIILEGAFEEGPVSTFEAEFSVSDENLCVGFHFWRPPF